MAKPTVAVVGASRDPSKYGNISVRAHLAAGYEVFPVNRKESEIEGLPVFKSVLEIPAELDRVVLYLPPHSGLEVIEEIARKGSKELFFNPGSESEALLKRAQELGLKPILACSIVALRR